jgi:carbon-monoxide dehydrogenase medium subunit
VVDFDFIEPTSVAQASQLLAQYGEDARLIAGGTALILALRQRMLQPRQLISLTKIEKLRGISVDSAGTLRIGALARHSEVAASPMVNSHHPVLARLARVLANPQVRNQGTFGGNLCYADPATDPPGCLYALDASITLGSQREERTIPIADFLVDYFTTAIAQDEILVSINIPPSATNRTAHYTRHLRTTAEHRPLVNITSVVQLENARCMDARLVTAGSTITPFRCAQAEALLRGQPITPALIDEAGRLVETEIAPISDSRGSEDYRRHVAGVVARRNLRQAFGLEPA